MKVMLLQGIFSFATLGAIQRIKRGDSEKCGHLLLENEKMKLEAHFYNNETHLAVDCCLRSTETRSNGHQQDCQRAV